MCLSCTGLCTSATAAGISSQAKPFTFGFSAKEVDDTGPQTETQDDGVQDEKVRQSTEVQRRYRQVFCCFYVTNKCSRLRSSPPCKAMACL